MLNQIYCKSIIFYPIVLDMCYGVYVEISEFWQRQNVWSSTRAVISFSSVTENRTRL
jgi:hypothetical protein